jgi:hypothetical protein
MNSILATGMALTIVFAGSAGPAKPRPLTSAEILAAIYNPSHRHQLERIHSFIASGTVLLGKQHGIATTYWKAPDEFVTVTKYSGESGSHAVGFDGRNGWLVYPGGYEFPLGPDEWYYDCLGIWLSNSDWFPDRWPTAVRYINQSIDDRRRTRAIRESHLCPLRNGGEIL